MILYITIFLLEVAGDYFSCAWHRARERDNLYSQISIAMFLQFLNWIPIWFVITEQDWKILAISIVGTGVGNALGAWKYRDPVKQSS